MHGTDFCNAGEKGLLYFRIEYGSVVREIDASKPVIRRLDPTNTASPWLSTGGQDKTCIHTSGYNTVMPIQETMTVEWQPVGGERRKVTIPIKKVMTNKHPVRSFKVGFYDDHIKVYQIYYQQRVYPLEDYKTVIFEY